MLTKTNGAALLGVNAFPITVEISIIQGTKIQMVGLPDSAIKESIQRVESAIKINNYTMPRQRLVVNLAPADLRKEGSAYDLPIALGILRASGQIITDIMASYVIMGELSLDGIIRPIKGSLSMALMAKELGLKGIIVPSANVREAAIVEGIDAIPVSSLNEAIDFLQKNKDIQPVKEDMRDIFNNKGYYSHLDFKDVQGQENTKRALTIAAAGGHNLLMIGPPGSGKSMLAKRMVTILPPMSIVEALETTKIHSVSNGVSKRRGIITQRPFRSPHHTISETALVGGGSIPQPGEISLAHNGILFLDELPEFKKKALEVMRQPLEDRKVLISRAKTSIELPASFMLLASMNPCPCGYYNSSDDRCTCGPFQIQNYINKISGPLLDRIDIHIEVEAVSFEQITSENTNEPSRQILERTIQAREIQLRRFTDYNSIHSNAMMPPSMIKKICKLKSSSIQLLKEAMRVLGLSARAYYRILKVARTIADLGHEEQILDEHIAEAIQCRTLDHNLWQEEKV